MEKIEIEYEKIKKIFYILNQFGGPIKITYSITSLNNITYKLVNEIHTIIKSCYENKQNCYFSIIELFSIIEILDYAIIDLGIEEFSTVTGLNYYDDGILLILDLKSILRAISN